MPLSRELSLMIRLDKAVDFRDVAERTSDLAHFCQLQNQADVKKFYTPDRFNYMGNKIQLMFSFGKN